MGLTKVMTSYFSAPKEKKRKGREKKLRKMKPPEENDAEALNGSERDSPAKTRGKILAKKGKRSWKVSLTGCRMRMFKEL